MKRSPLLALGILTLCLAALRPLDIPQDSSLSQIAHECAAEAKSVPEPSTYVMILSGAGMLVMFGRFRRKG